MNSQQSRGWYGDERKRDIDLFDRLSVHYDLPSGRHIWPSSSRLVVMEYCDPYFCEACIEFEWRRLLGEPYQRPGTRQRELA